MGPIKQGKKSWRKRIDVADVESALSAKRSEELTHGSAISSLANEGLFFLDKLSGSTALDRKREARNAKLRSLAILEPNPHVKTVPSSRKRKRSTDIAGGKAKVEQKDIGKKTRETKEISEAGIYDVWASKQPASKNVEKQLREQRSGVHKVVDTPALSYNPDLESHQDALGVIIAKHLQDEKKVQRFGWNTPFKHSTDENDLRVDTDDVEDDQTETSLKKPHQGSEKLSKTERNKKLGKRIIAEQQSRKAARQRLSAEIDRLPSILEEIESEEALKLQTKALYRHSKKNQAKVNNVLDVPLSDELPESLRQLRPRGNLLKDIWKTRVKERKL